MAENSNQKKLLKIKPFSYLSNIDYFPSNNHPKTQRVHFAPEITSPDLSRNPMLKNQLSNKTLNPKNLKNVTFGIKNRNNSVKLPPLLRKKEDCSFYKMKKYIVPIPKIRHHKKISSIKIEEKTSEKKEDEKNTISEKSDEKEANTDQKENPEEVPVMDFNKYLKMQSIAEVRLRPRFGDTSLNLENYIKKVGVIRKQIMDHLMQELNNTENRYNDERPEVDSKFRTKSKVLADNSWKNSFSLEEYQKFFSKSLKGKISSMNYRLMLKRFRQISNMCFAEGNLNVASIRKMDSGDY